MILFFGDSLVSAENNNFNGFVEKLNHKDYINLGVSGTCFGNYSLYPVGKNNLCDLIFKEEKRIKDADTIFLEYGSNDVSSVTLGCTTNQNVLIELVKVIDAINQINPNLNIYFITLGENSTKFGKGQIHYLKNEYFKDINEALFKDLDDEKLIKKWIMNYNFLNFFIKKVLKNVIELPTLNDDEIDIDKMHPNDKGYLKISKFIEGIINGK